MAEYKSPLNIYGLKCFNAPEVGEKFSEKYAISSVIAIPASSTIYETCGHTGYLEDLSYPSDLKEEILRAFHNIDAALKAGGLSDPWKQVYRMTSYHVGDLDLHEAGLEAALENYFGENRPAWTGVRVAGLSGGARIEIQVTAFGPAK